jgi:hypothetical protein
MRGFDGARAAGLLRVAGLVPADRERPGDILLADSGPLQVHLMIRARCGLVHAHAGLGRVVLMPCPSPWPVRGIWRAMAPAGCA